MANMRHEFINTELIDRTIASIRRGRFDMERWDQCICGHVMRVDRSPLHGLRDDKDMIEFAGRRLGINVADALNLFMTDLCVSKAEAICALEILRDHGVVSWRSARAKALDEKLAALKSRMPKTLAEAERAFDDLVAEARVRALA